MSNVDAAAEPNLLGLVLRLKLQLIYCEFVRLRVTPIHAASDEPPLRAARMRKLVSGGSKALQVLSGEYRFGSDCKALCEPR